MVYKVLTVKNIRFSKSYLTNLVKELNQYKNIVYLRGVPLPELKRKPLHYSESGFLVFKVENGLPLIFKTVWDSQFFFRHQAELFVYQNLAQKKTVTNFIANLITYKNKPLPYFVIEFLDSYRPLGDDHQVKIKLNEFLLTKIVQALTNFHSLKVDKKPFLNQQRSTNFYQEKLSKLKTAKRADKYFGAEMKNKLLKFLYKNSAGFSDDNFFIMGDRNPSNIFVQPQKKIIKFIDFDRIGFGNPALDYTYFHLTLINQPQIVESLLKRLKHSYSHIPSFWMRYWFDLLIRCIDEMSYWENKNVSNFQLLKSTFRETLLKLNK